MRFRFIAAVLVLVTVTPVYAAIISIQPSSSMVSSGGTASVMIEVSGVSDLFAFQFDIGFNPAILSAISVSEGPFLPTGGNTLFIPGLIDNTAGLISGTADALIGAIPGVSGTGVLAEIQLQGIGTGTSPVTLSNVILIDSSGGDITATVVDGSVRSVVPEPRQAAAVYLALLILIEAARRRRLLARSG
jgi:cohesin domain-containing protein